MVLRVLLMVNAVGVFAALQRSASIAHWPLGIAEGAAWIEPALLGTLLSLCHLRAFLMRYPAWLQKTFAAAMACLWAGIATYAVDWLLPSTEPQFFEWERSLGALCMAWVVMHYFELRTRASSPALSEARLQALQARIRPHFLFNSLNAVTSLVRTDPRQAERSLEDLSDLFRALMRETRKTVLLEEEVSLCRQYLGIEALRLGDRLRVAWDVDDVLPRIQVPSLLLQPLLENAVVHGIEPSAHGGEIHIAVFQRRERVIVRIRNPLVRKSSEIGAIVLQRGNQMALENIRERLRLLYDLAADLDAREENDHYIVQLTLPAKP